MCHTVITFIRTLFIALLISITAYFSPTFAQQPAPKPTPAAAQDEVLRIETELVQTPVMVFDKQGRFVDNLKRESFELRMDGQAQPLSFFERVTAGSAKEAEQYEAARKGSSQKKALIRPTTYGRTLIFFVDDYHLSTESTQRTRDALKRFIDNSMGQNDSAVITTATGQLGFLQQLTDNKDVLRLAIDRLKFRPSAGVDRESPPMTPYQAVIIEQGSDEGVLKYFSDIVIKTEMAGVLNQISAMSNNPGAAERMMEQLRRQAEQSVKTRARRILSQYGMINIMTYSALENLMRAAIQLPGSKLVVLISDGFHLAGQKSGELQRLQSLTDAAVRAGAVIYSIQASGLNTSMPDAKSEVRISPDMESGRAGVGEDTSIQSPLYTLAIDTGGQPFFNSNSMDDGIKKAVRETSEYYLLAWQPQNQGNVKDRFRKIQVVVKDRPDLTVRTQKAFLDQTATPSAEASAKTKPTPSSSPTAASKSSEDVMQEALSSTFPITDLPTSLAVSYVDLPKDGTKLISVTEVLSGVLFMENAADKAPREIEVVGVVLNDEGKATGSFNGRLTANNEAAGATRLDEQTVFQVARTQIKPGLYQIRVAARDTKSGRKGSASQWLQVPDLSSKRLAMSSLLIGEKALEVAGKKAGVDADQRARLSVNHHFSRNSQLRFLTYVYNAARGSGGTAPPDLSVQMRIMRDNQTISTSPALKVETTGVEDMARIPYAAQVRLGTLQPGRYTLLVSITDQNAKASATQSIGFWVE